MKTHQTQFMALGSEISLCLVSDNSETAKDLLNILRKQILLFEKQFSRFLPASELSRFNRAAGQRQRVSADFLAILQTSLKWAHATDGLFNPFILPSLQRAGYKQSFAPGYEHDVHDDHSDKQLISFTSLELGDGWACIPYGTAIDLGGIGKGFLADRLRTYVEAQVAGYWFSLGGDVVYGGRDEQDNPWKLRIHDKDERLLGLVASMDATGAVATSGVTKRQGTYQGTAWHHIIDPRTGKPATTDIMQVSVACGDAVAADVLAKISVIVGSSQAFDVLKKHGAQGGLMQYRSKNNELKQAFFGTTVTDMKTPQVQYA